MAFFNLHWEVTVAWLISVAMVWNAEW